MFSDKLIACYQTGWRSGQSAVGLEFDSWSGLIGQIVANGSPCTIATFLGRCVAQALNRGDGYHRSLHALA